jgi:hypothetical protein
MRQLVRGWQLSGIFAMRTGSPLYLMNNKDIQGFSPVEDTPDVIGDWHISHSNKASEINEWFNTAAFAESTGYGNYHEGSIPGPGAWNLDSGLERTFKFMDRYDLNLRGSFYNTLNHANLNSPTTQIGGPRFGRITGTSSPRVIELSTRIVF